MTEFTQLALIGGGPSALFACKNLLKTNQRELSVHIFEAGNQAGAGMPYSSKGANSEHVTNVSANEIPEIFIPLLDWLKSLPQKKLDSYSLDRNKLSEYRVIPRLLFGEYLSAQFDIFLQEARDMGIEAKIHFNCRVTDITKIDEKVQILINDSEQKIFDKVIICTGHYWPKKNEGKTPRYFDSPYPPSKLSLQLNHKIAIRGSSLTAIDAIKTLARNNGEFIRNNEGKLFFNIAETSPEFGIVMHSVHGLLPCLRFHLDEPLISGKDLISEDDIKKHMDDNEGFLSVDYVFEKNFKEAFKKKRPEFYQSIKDMSIEDFVDAMLSRRENIDPFTLFRQEYEEAEISLKEHRSIYWKEMLASLSFALNYPAKHFSAEDMLRLQKTLMPLIAVVIAFIPQGSADELLALHEAGRLQLVSVDKESHVEPNPDGGGIYIRKDENGEEIRETYLTYVDSVGQKHFAFEEFPFKGLLEGGAVSPARLKYKSKEEYLDLPGVAISDDFQIISKKSEASDNIFIMAVPYISGHNPDYSGLDFCEEASKRIMARIKG